MTIAIRYGATIVALDKIGGGHPLLSWQVVTLQGDDLRDLTPDVWTRGLPPEVILGDPATAQDAIFGGLREFPSPLTEEEAEEVARIRRHEIAHRAARVAVALDPINALLVALGMPRGRLDSRAKHVDYCRTMHDTFGTSHLPEDRRRWKWKFARWGSAPTRSETLLAADRGDSVAAAFGR